MQKRKTGKNVGEKKRGKSREKGEGKAERKERERQECAQQKIPSSVSSVVQTGDWTSLLLLLSLSSLLSFLSVVAVIPVRCCGHFEAISWLHSRDSHS